MNIIHITLGILLGGAILTYFANKISGILRDILFISTIVIATVLFFVQMSPDTVANFNLGGITLSLGLNHFGLFFSIIILGLAVLAGFYSLPYMKGKGNLGFFYMNYLLSIFGMLGIVMAKDLVSFFIFWEIMTWSSYLIVVYNGKETNKIGIKYILFSALGAYSMLMAIVMVYSQLHSFAISDLIAGYTSLTTGYQITIALLLMTGFTVKAAMMPLHVWAPEAYSNAPMSFTAMFSGALSKMGVYGLVIVFVSMVSYLPHNFWIRETVAWLGAITAALGTLYAIFQDDLKKLLAYSSVAQLGYIITGVAIGTQQAMIAALMLAVLHAIFKATLFMVAGAVERQTGTTDMTVLTGLIRKMPWTFVSALFSIIALAGMPPLAGLIGKWMLYESIIANGNYILVIVIFFSSTAAFLYCYKVLYGVFLGQEEPEFKNVKEAPALMVIPMLINSLLLLIFGVFPGYILKYIDNALVVMGFPVSQNKWWEISTIFNEWGNKVNTDLVAYTIVIVFLAAAILLFFRWKNTRYVSTKDISLSGEMPKEDENYSFKLDFYKPFERAISPLLKYKISYYYKGFADGMEAFFDWVRRLYNGNAQTYAIYVITFLAILLLFANTFFTV
jgi:formate hydrogenlyase subunit 3/multisubunit Na+/H+ antiporter MnhD subunit